MRTRLLGGAVMATALVAVSACGNSNAAKTASGARLVKSGTLTVCADAPYPPFEDFDKGSPTGFKGFDIDIVSSVSHAMGLKPVVKKMSFDALQSGLALNSGRCDLAASAMTITKDREKNLDFTDGYYDSKQSLLVPKGSAIKSIDDLKGKKVGVQQGTTGKAYAEKHAAGAKLTSYPSDGEMYAALKAGQVDALLQDLPVNLNHQNDPKQKGKYTVIQTYAVDEKYGFAIKQGNTALVDEVNKALREVRGDGTYDKLYNKYFDTK